MDAASHKQHERIKIDAFDVSGPVEVAVDDDLLQSSDVRLMKIFLKDSRLQLDEVVVVEDQVSVLVTDSQDAEQCALEVRLERFCQRIVKWLNRIQVSSLGGGNDVNQIDMHLSGAFDAVLHLLKGLEIIVQEVLVFVAVGGPIPQVNLVADEDDRCSLVDLDDARHPVLLEALLAFVVVHVVDEDDHVALLDHAVDLLLIFFARTAVDQLREIFVWHHVVVGRDGDGVKSLLHLSREIVGDKREYNRGLADALVAEEENAYFAFRYCLFIGDISLLLTTVAELSLHLQARAGDCLPGRQPAQLKLLCIGWLRRCAVDAVA